MCHLKLPRKSTSNGDIKKKNIHIVCEVHIKVGSNESVKFVEMVIPGYVWHRMIAIITEHSVPSESWNTV